MIRGIEESFSEGAKSFFLNFFPAWYTISRWKIPTKKNFSGFEKWKKKKKKKVLSLICNFSSFHLLPFSIFHLSYFYFPSFLIFPSLSFPGRSAEISWWQVSEGALCPLYVPTCIHLFPHARTDTIQVVEHEPNFSKFYPLTISFLVSQFCTLESSLCVSSSDYYLISPFGSSLIKVVLDPKIRTTECTHQTTSVQRMNSWLITM